MALSNARQIYDTLNDQGNRYAGWAVDVARGDSTTGVAALNFLQDTALMAWAVKPAAT
ncbi:MULTISPECIES: hypothetical protein [Giesbergeria]|uniref:Uncharacterized protein n=1 Tax=Giesbergeria sinuosa TaxID=80883 RepID=A0ABV9QF02_9BURK